MGSALKRALLTETLLEEQPGEGCGNVGKGV